MKRWYGRVALLWLIPVMAIESQASAPTLLTGDSPRYPAMLQSAGVAGRVIADWVVDSLGVVRLEKSNALERGHDLFWYSVRVAARQRRYTPAMDVGRPIDAVVRDTFTFVLLADSVMRCPSSSSHNVRVCGVEEPQIVSFSHGEGPMTRQQRSLMLDSTRAAYRRWLERRPDEYRIRVAERSDWNVDSLYAAMFRVLHHEGSELAAVEYDTTYWFPRVIVLGGWTHGTRRITVERFLR